jgi:hypothetical protein
MLQKSFRTLVSVLALSGVLSVAVVAPASADTETYCATAIALSDADKIEVKIVPSDTLAQGRKKLAVFRAVWVKMLKPAPAELRPLITQTIGHIDMATRDFTRAVKYPSQKAKYLAKFNADFELIAADLDEWEKDVNERCA